MTPEEIESIVSSLRMIMDMTSSKPNELLAVYAAIFGAVAGAIATFFPTFFIECYRNKKASQRVQAAQLAEIASLLEIIRHRNYQCGVRAAISRFESQE
jgi:hypothetical protein